MDMRILDDGDKREKFIYGLVDPFTNEVRYIGKSIRPELRLKDHMNDVSNCHRSHWLQSLKSKGEIPDLIILESVSGSWPWQESECYWIAKGKALGWPLTNNTSGGDGVANLPAETREKMRQTWLGRKHSPETLLKLSAASKGRVKTPEMKAHMHKAMVGRCITWGDKLSKALRKISPEQEIQIRARLANGELNKDLAAEFGVDRTTLSKVKMGTYHLPYRKVSQ